MTQAPNDTILEMGTPTVQQPIKKRNFTFPKWTKGIIFFAILALSGVGIARCNAEKKENSVNTRALAPLNSSALSQINTEEQTEEYKKNLGQYTQAKIEESAKSGQSFVSPASQPNSKPSLYEVEQPKHASAASPAVPSTLRQNPPAQRPVQRQKGDPVMLSYLSSLENKLAGQGSGQVLTVHNKPTPRTSPATMQTQQYTSPPAAPGLKAGDILYSITNISLDSDAPGPIMARIVDNSPYKGSKVIGAFKRSNEHLTIEFETIITPHGETYKIKGYAVDPQTDRTAVRTSVDNHTLERWGGLIAASFVQGFGQAVGQSGSTSYTGVYGSSTSLPKYDLQDQLWIAGGKVGERLANVFERNFDRPPTVVLQSGSEIGILIVSVGNTATDTSVQQSSFIQTPNRPKSVYNSNNNQHIQQ